jgi:hypothetical protein
LMTYNRPGLEWEILLPHSRHPRPYDISVTNVGFIPPSFRVLGRSVIGWISQTGSSREINQGVVVIET